MATATIKGTEVPVFGGWTPTPTYQAGYKYSSMMQNTPQFDSQLWGVQGENYIYVTKHPLSESVNIAFFVDKNGQFVKAVPFDTGGRGLNDSLQAEEPPAQYLGVPNEPNMFTMSAYGATTYGTPNTGTAQQVANQAGGTPEKVGGAPPPPPVAPAPTPQAAPTYAPGTEPIDPNQQKVAGTLNGKPVYQNPDGTYFTTRPDANGNQILDMTFDDPNGMGGFVPTGQGAAAPNQPVQTQTAPTPTAPTPQNQPVQNVAPTPTSAPQTQPAPQQPQISPEQIQQAMQQSGIPEMMQQAGLTPDQQKAIEAVYQATLANDQSYADRIAAAMQAAREYSSPYFDAQIALVSDSLSRALGAQEGDLAFRENQLNSALTKLQQDLSASKDYLSFTHEQELTDLARRYEINLEDTRQSMAATGFTQSSRRSKAEQYLGDVNEGAVESSNRSFAYQTGGMDRQLAFQTTDTQAQIANLQRLAQEGKLDLLRQTEAQLGSTGLGQLGFTGTDVLGGIGGTIPRQQALDQLNFSTQYVF